MGAKQSVPDLEQSVPDLDWSYQVTLRTSPQCTTSVTMIAKRFDGKDFSVWELRARSLLVYNDLLDCIDGIGKPVRPQPIDYEFQGSSLVLIRNQSDMAEYEKKMVPWEKKDAKALALIIGMLSDKTLKEIEAILGPTATPQEVMTHLNIFYGGS